MGPSVRRRVGDLGWWLLAPSAVAYCVLFWEGFDHRWMWFAGAVLSFVVIGLVCWADSGTTKRPDH